jgi:hypothetical protein
MNMPFDAFAYGMFLLGVLGLVMPNVPYDKDETRKASPFAAVAILLIVAVGWALIDSNEQDWKDARDRRAAAAETR